MWNNGSAWLARRRWGEALPEGAGQITETPTIAM